jgi:MiaB/RimO family radical SAM methylthiotransferase
VQDWPLQLHKALNTAEKPTFIRQLSTPVATQYLKIAEGCSHRCSFCAIPFIRGNFKGRDIPDVIAEAQWLQSRGVKECILVSQDTSYFGKDRGTTLLELLAELLSKTSFPWIRLMYLHPALVDKEFLRFVALHKRILPYFDIPLQHISDEILIAMKRQPLSSGIYDLVDSIRDILPDAAIRTTFITGFPGEKEKHFGELMDFVEYAQFERLGVFPFSPEKGTSAFSMKNRPRTTTAVARCEEIMTLQAGISRVKSMSRINKVLDVIIDTDGSESSPDIAPGCAEGRTIWDAPEVDGIVSVANCSCKPGTIIPVKITGASDYDLKGTAVIR